MAAVVAASTVMATTTSTTTVTTSTTAVTATPPGSPKPISKSWFQEKYIQQIYDDYYEYTLTRYELGDNDHDVCPDIYKSSLIFAITGQHITRTCSALYMNIETTKSYDHDDKDDQAVQFITGIMTSIIEFIGKFICYTFEISMLILSIILACCSTIFMIILLFCQY